MCTHISHIIDINNDRRPSGVGPLGQNQEDAGAQPPPQSVHLQSSGAPRSHSGAHTGRLLGARLRHTSRVYAPGGGLEALCLRARAGWEGGALPSPTLSLSRPHSCAPWGRWAHRQWQDRRGMLAMSRVLSGSAEGPWGSDPRFPPPLSGSSLRRPLDRCGCPGRLWPACNRSRPPGSRLGWWVRRPGPGGPPPASQGSG